MDSCWTCGNPFHSYENCLKEIASRKERVPETYDYRSQYDAYECDTYHANYNIEMEDDTMYRAKYGDQYFHCSSYETPSFFNQPQRPTQGYYCQEENQRYEASFAAHEASFAALETHVNRLVKQLNRDETYELQGITMLDFDDEDEDEGEEQNEISFCQSKNMIKNRFPLIGEEVMEANTTPYLPTLEEPILSPIDDIRSKDEEEFLALSLYKDLCSNLLDEAEVSHIQNLPQLPRVAINQVREDDSVFENKKEQEKVSLVKDEHHVVEQRYENLFCKLTHIILKQVHRKVRVGV
nr:hypothetical protein [Tanacetum cinerariifolium]